MHNDASLLKKWWSRKGSLVCLVPKGSLWLGLLGMTLLTLPAHAQLLKEGVSVEVMKQVNAGALVTTTPEGLKDPRQIAYEAIQLLLGLLGTIMTVLLLMSGYWYIIARGREEYVEKAQDTSRRAIIGLIIILASFAVAKFFLGNVGGVIDQGEKYFNQPQPQSK